MLVILGRKKELFCLTSKEVQIQASSPGLAHLQCRLSAKLQCRPRAASAAAMPAGERVEGHRGFRFRKGDRT